MDSGSVNETLSLIGRILQLGKKATNVQYEEVIQAAREAILQQKEINLNLREENGALKERLSTVDDYVLDKSVYWQSSDDERNQPFCPACYAGGKKVPLQKTREERDKTQTRWHCPDKKCNAYYNPWGHKEPTSSSVIGGSYY